MTGNNQINSSLSAPNKSMQETGNINQMLEQLHADFDPVYSMLMNYQCAVMEVETKFNVLNNRLSLQDEHNPIESIKSRVKSLDSIIRKLDRLGLPITIESAEENLHDIAGVRVICSFVDDIYRIEECFLAQEDVTLVKRKDYIRDPNQAAIEACTLSSRHRSIRKTGKRTCLLRSRCGRSPWISGQALNINCGIKRISIHRPLKSWQKSWKHVRKKAQSWMKKCFGSGSVSQGIEPADRKGKQRIQP